MKGENQDRLEKLREEIDLVDKNMMDLLKQRMKISEDIAAYKKENNIPILDMERERRKINEIAKSVPEDISSYTRILYSLLAEMSKERQRGYNGISGRFFDMIEEALKNTENEFPSGILAACYGSEGTFGQLASDRFFKMPIILYFRNYESVMSAVANGLCRYGVLPMQLGEQGSIDRIYELIVKHNLHIVRSTRIKLDYNLAGKKNLKVEEIKIIYTTETAKRNCERFFSELSNIRYIICDSEAAAAKLVRQGNYSNAAAVTTSRCASIYDLSLIKESIQADELKEGEFICVSKKVEIYPGSDRTSLVMTLENKPGELYKVLGKFFARDINVRKVETRAIKNRDFETRVYIDFEISIYSHEFKELLVELDDFGREIYYLGTYLEI